MKAQAFRAAVVPVRHRFNVVGVVLGAALAVASFAPSVQAGGDLAPVAPARPFSWSGCYLGMQAGYSWNNVSGVDTTLAGGNPAAYDYAADGIVLGGHVGCALQRGVFVFGVEGDLEVTGADGDGIAPAPIDPYFHRTSIDWMGSARARAGIVHGSSLFYVTGGWAWAEVDHKFGEAPGTTFFHTYSDIRDGWTLGGGVESIVKAGLTVRVEYRYTDLGSVTNSNPSTNSLDRNDMTSHALRLGLSARF